MSTLEENKIHDIVQEDIHKKIYELKAKQLKEDKAFYDNYQPGWFDNLLDLDIASLKQMEDWMDNVIEKENSPELTQFWVFYRDIIRFSYYFLTFRWIKFTKECYFTVKAQEISDDFINYMKEDCQKQNMVFDKDWFQYCMKKVSSAFEGDVWQIVEETVKVARSFKDTSCGWVGYYAEYNKNLMPELKKFSSKHAEEVKSYLWNNFTGYLGVWIKLFNTVPLESLEYSTVVLENFFLRNQIVRQSFFEDQKRANPLRAKNLNLQTEILWNRLSHKLGYAKDVIGNTINSSLLSFFSVEESQIINLRLEQIYIRFRHEFPLRVEKCLNLFSLAISQKFENSSSFESHQQKIIKLNNIIERKLEGLFRKIDGHDQTILQLEKLEKKSDETVESRQKKLDEEFAKLQTQKEEDFEKVIARLEKSLEDNNNVLKSVMKEILESKEIQRIEYNRQQEQKKSDKKWKEEYDAKVAKENQSDLVRNIVRKINHTNEEKFQTKLQTIEEEHKLRLEREARAKRKAELEVFEQQYKEEEEKTQLLIKQKKRIPKRKPEAITLEKQRMEELQMVRQKEEEDKAMEAERLLKKQNEEEQKKKSNFIINYVNATQKDLQEWMQEKGNKMSNFHPVTFLKDTVNSIINSAGESMLWGASIMSTLLFGPLDNFKLIHQLGNKTSYLYKKALAQRHLIPNPQPIFEEMNFSSEAMKKYFSEFEAHPLRKGNMVRLLKHNILGSDVLSLAFFQMAQDKLMSYTSGTYQAYNNAVAGALSGAMVAFLMNPIDCFKTLYVATDLRVQTSIKNIHVHVGCGLSASILSSAVYRGLQFSLYEYFKKETYRKTHKISNEEFDRTTSYKNYNQYNNYINLGQKYVAAVSASLIGSFIAYPLDTARKIIYTDIYIEDPQKRITTINRALSLSNRWYGGFQYNCIKQILQPLTLVLWDHAASRLCSKSNIHNYLY